MALVLAFAYGLTLERHVGLGDSAKFQLVGAVLGTPHAPGYPVYVIVNHLFLRLVPLGSWALESNLLSASATVGAALLLLEACVESGIRRWAAGASALAFGLLPPVWSQARFAEVYPLHLLLMAGLLWAAARFRRTGREGFLWAALILLSLALGNHPTAILAVPALAVLVGGRAAGLLRRPATWAGLAGVALLALAPYSYLVVRTWHGTAELLEIQAHSLAQLVDVVTGAQHRWNLFELSARDVLTARIPWLGREIVEGLGLLLPLTLLGFVRLARLPALAAGLWSLTVGAFTLLYTVSDLEVHLLPVYLALALPTAAGLERTGERLWRHRPEVVAAALVAVALLATRPWVDPGAELRRRTVERAVGALAHVPRRAVLLCADYGSSMTFLHLELLRPAERRVRVIHVPAPALRIGLPLEPMRRYLAAGIPFRYGHGDELVSPGLPVYAYLPVAGQSDRMTELGFDVHPVADGLYRLTPPPADRARPLLPPALLVHRLETVRTLPAAVARLGAASFDPRRSAVAIVRGGTRDLVSASASAGAVEPGAVSVEAWEEDRLVVATAGSSPGWLVLTDSFADRWTFTVDGRPTAARRVDVLWVAVPVPAGRHLVEVARDRRPFAWRRFAASPWTYLLLASPAETPRGWRGERGRG